MSVSNCGQVELWLEINYIIKIYTVYIKIKTVHSLLSYVSAQLYLKISPSVGSGYLFSFLKCFQGTAAHSFVCGISIVFEALKHRNFNSEV